MRQSNLKYEAINSGERRAESWRAGERRGEGEERVRLQEKAGAKLQLVKSKRRTGSREPKMNKEQGTINEEQGTRNKNEERGTKNDKLIHL